MSANILVIEYEPRYVEHVRTALADSGFRLEIAGNMDDAVNRCAHFEPTTVIITSVLPNLKVEDAITQLRARAGLRVTPFLILMSGYQGEDSKDDAVRFGAQDILQRPFGSDDLLQRVTALVNEAPNPAETQAIPQEMLEALRRNAGLSGGENSVTSDELFGDILSDVEGEEPASRKVTVDPPVAPPPAQPTDVDKALAEILESTKNAPPPKRKVVEDTDVDKMLSDTLSGLEIRQHFAPPRDEPTAIPQAPETPVPPPFDDETSDVFGPASDDVELPPPPAAKEEVVELPPPPPAGEPEEVQPVVPPPAVPPPVSPTADTPAAPAPPSIPKPVEAASAGVQKKGPASSGTEFGQYLIEEHIATGGMAEVYKARMMGMEGFQKTVAIKRILSNLTDSDEFVRMFIDEAKLAAQLNHNNIIHIYDLGKVDRSHYIAMEFIEGRDLRSILTQCSEAGRKIPIPVALHIATLLASALDYAHKKRDFEDRDLGLVHRDVSPQNVLISFEGDVKLCDFGIAKAASKASQTRAGALKGKLQYMSPEQAWGKNIDHRSDIFSLGLVLFEMLTSGKVFAGDSELSVLEQVRDPIIPAPSSKNPDIDAEIDRIIFMALHADREERYQSALEMQRDIERVLRMHGWSPDKAAIVAFFDELEGRKPAADQRPTVVADVGMVPPPKPPPVVPVEPPPGFEREPAQTDESQESIDGVFDLPASDPELERALTETAEDPPEVSSLSDRMGDSFYASPPTDDGGRRRLWILLGLLAVVAAVVVGWWYFGRTDSAKPPVTRGAPVVVAPTETPTPAPEDGLLTEDELIERAREVAAAEIVKQEEELRQRLEVEFPTPTPIPPTPTPTITPTLTTTPRPTAVPPTRTPVPPTRTPIPPTPTPSVREGDIVTPGPGVTLPVIIQQEPPVYPRIAERMGRTGLVEAAALVGVDGRVEEVRITGVDTKGLGFEKATQDAVAKWRYKPATKLGVKVRMWVPIRVPFVEK